MKMKTDVKEFLTRSSTKGAPLLGKPSLVCKLSDSSHSSARILTVRTQSSTEVYVLKQVKTLSTPLLGKYLLKDGEQTPALIAGQGKNLIHEITDDDLKDVEKFEKFTESRILQLKQKLEQVEANADKDKENEKVKEKEKEKEKEKDKTSKKKEVKKEAKNEDKNTKKTINTNEVIQTIEKLERRGAPIGFKYVYVPFEFCSQKVPFCDGADELLECSEFLVESAVDYLIKTHVESKIPFFLTSVDSWRSKRHGNILIRNGGFDMNSYFSFYGLIQIQAIVLQVMYAIAWAQKYIHLKHHDLHCGNVFIDGEVNENTQLKFPNGSTFTLPAKMPKIVIADYGLSSATDPSTKSRVTRADFHLMETSRSGSQSRSRSRSRKSKCSHSGSCRSKNRSVIDCSETDYSDSDDEGDEDEEDSDYDDSYNDNEDEDDESESSTLEMSRVDSKSKKDESKEKGEVEEDDEDGEGEGEEENDWGEWTHELNPNHSKRHMGYDIACFVSNLQEEAVDRKHESLDWLNDAIQLMEQLDPAFQLTTRGRPLASSTFTIDQLADLMKFDPTFLYLKEKEKEKVKESKKEEEGSRFKKVKLGSK